MLVVLLVENLTPTFKDIMKCKAIGPISLLYQNYFVVNVLNKYITDANK